MEWKTNLLTETELDLGGRVFVSVERGLVRLVELDGFVQSPDPLVPGLQRSGRQRETPGRADHVEFVAVAVLRRRRRQLHFHAQQRQLVVQPQTAAAP